MFRVKLVIYIYSFENAFKLGNMSVLGKAMELSLGRKKRILHLFSQHGPGRLFSLHTLASDCE